MKNLAKTIKTLAAGVAATALIPCGLLTAQAVTPEQYAVVKGFDCQIYFDGRTPYEVRDLNKDEDVIAMPVPSDVTKVQAHCLTGQGDVPLTSSPDTVGVDYIKNPTESDPIFVIDRMPAAAVEAPTEAPAEVESTTPAAPADKKDVQTTQKQIKNSKTTAVKKTQTVANTTHNSPSTKSISKSNSASSAQQVVGKNGKVIETTTPSESNRSAGVVEATDMTANNSSESTGTASQDIAQEDASASFDSNLSAAQTNTSDTAVDGQNIEASQYAVANLSLVDRMGGAGTLVGIAILGLIGAAGAISLTRSIILG